MADHGMKTGFLEFWVVLQLLWTALSITPTIRLAAKHKKKQVLQDNSNSQCHLYLQWCLQVRSSYNKT